MSNDLLIKELANKARIASSTLRGSSIESRRAAIHSIAKAIENNVSEILAANNEDMNRERSAGLSESLLDRLELTEKRILGIVESNRKVASLPDPLGRILKSGILPNGLKQNLVTVPFGVVGMIYEARPNVTVDASVILLMSGNAALLRGSSTARRSNEILVQIMKSALAATEISPEVIQLIPSDDRDTVRALLHARGNVDLVIPRGSASLIRTVVDEALVPTIETGAGVCHVYVDKYADLEMAIPIIVNSKTHRPSVCNAAETLLVHSAISDNFLPKALSELSSRGVKLNCDLQSLEIARKNGITANPATSESWGTEYGTLEMNIAVVSDVDEAIEHIRTFGTQHTEAIVSENEPTIERFIALSDCAAVMVNTSTRFTDGEEMGFGAEIGISNQKLHARGPMGLEAMTTTTWIVRGEGQIRE
ncbi:MAG: glutamate-5-semialdehyde dehydrogenase [Actinomycetales bacterium]|jgi:glutamate-5-semialdehyde dehydrogenase|nr:glutamate-5-semialdehyde dehydrogenase [Actinomycetales bacterium]